MKTRITADQARSLAKRSLDRKIDDICAAIEEIARKGNNSLNTRTDYSKDEDLWNSKNSQDRIKARDILTDLGFHVEFFPDQTSFASNMRACTVINW